jgi:hypothetical protein
MSNGEKKRSDFKNYRADEFMVKFLSPGPRGVNVIVQKRRKERRPGTLSLYEVPIFECNAKDFEEEPEKCAAALIRTMMEHSPNIEDLRLTQVGKKVEDDEEEEVPGI